MNILEAAKQLDGCQYGNEGNTKLFDEMKKNRLVAVFGASDDLVEFRGAIYDELGAFDGTVFHIDSEGVIELERSECDEGNNCPYYQKYQKLRKKNSVQIEATWCPEDSDAAWEMWSVDFAYATFHIYEREELYCVGMVFSMVDIELAIDTVKE